MRKQDILVSINPTHLCFNNCEYCYLGALRNNTSILDISILDIRLNEILEYYNITHIDIYGGDLSVLDKDYLTKLLKCANKFCNDITVITDIFDDILQLKNQFNFNISTSVNVERRYNADLTHSDTVIYTFLPSMLNIDVKQFLSLQTTDIGFNQYYDAKLSTVHYKMSNRQYADFLISILDAYDPNINKFKITNIYELENAYKKNINVFADSHVFIMPNGKFAQVKYDPIEEFEYFNNIEYLKALRKNEELEFKCKHCALCKYNMNCIAEHLHVWDISDECCGMKSVLDWYIINRSKFKQYGKLGIV